MLGRGHMTLSPDEVSDRTQRSPRMQRLWAHTDRCAVLATWRPQEAKAHVPFNRLSQTPSRPSTRCPTDRGLIITVQSIDMTPVEWSFPPDQGNDVLTSTSLSSQKEEQKNFPTETLTPSLQPFLLHFPPASDLLMVKECRYPKMPHFQFKPALEVGSTSLLRQVISVLASWLWKETKRKTPMHSRVF